MATVVTHASATPGLPLPTRFPPVEDFRSLPVAKQRTITFSEDTTNNTFFMDSGAGAAQFNPNRVDSTIQAGTVEEWTINNATAELHVFHIHQTDFQVLEINGVKQDFIGHQDNVNVPFQTPGGPPGSVKVRIDFRDPNIVGKFVYHCHILEHGDGGMMSIAEVVPPNSATDTLQRSCRTGARPTAMSLGTRSRGSSPGTSARRRSCPEPRRPMPSASSGCRLVPIANHWRQVMMKVHRQENPRGPDPGHRTERLRVGARRQRQSAAAWQTRRCADIDP